jgi:hypothetical protein
MRDALSLLSVLLVLMEKRRHKRRSCVNWLLLFDEAREVLCSVVDVVVALGL